MLIGIGPAETWAASFERMCRPLATSASDRSRPTQAKFGGRTSGRNCGMSIVQTLLSSELSIAVSIVTPRSGTPPVTYVGLVRVRVRFRVRLGLGLGLVYG